MLPDNRQREVTTMGFSNPYLDEFNILKVHHRHQTEFYDARLKQAAIDAQLITERQALVEKYSCAIPHNMALRTITNRSDQIIEIGAGTGYWAKLLTTYRTGKHAHKINVIAIDSDPPGPSNQSGHREAFYPVQEGTESLICEYDEYDLLLCWPPYQSNLAYNAARLFNGKYLYYVGESSGGNCANDQFFDYLEDEFYEVDCCSIPQWPGIHDQLFVYRSKTA